MHLLKRTILAFLAVFVLLVTPVVAAVAYQASYTVTETNSSDYTMLAVLGMVDNDWLADNGFMEADALDTRIQTLSGLLKPHMVAEDRTLTAIPVPADSQTNLYFTTANSDLSSMYVIAGYNGRITTPDDASIELGDDFEVEQKGYIDTTGGADVNLVYKEDAFQTYVDGANDITSAIYGSTSPYSSTSDGHVFNADGNYATAWGAATGAVDDANTTCQIGQEWSGVVYNVYRTFLFFDTSSIPDGATIIGATLMLYGAIDNSDTDFDITIQDGQPTYPHDPLVIGDYSKAHYSGDGGTFNTSGFSAVGYNDITLNGTGLTWITKTGTTKLSIRSSRDIAGTVPVGKERVTIRCAEEAGVSKDPQLVVEYELEVTATGVSSGEHTVKTVAEKDIFLEVNGLSEDDYVSHADTASLDFGTGDFSVEYWLNIGSAAVSLIRSCIAKTNTYGSSPGWFTGISTWGCDGTNFKIISALTNGVWGTGRLASSTLLSLDTWYHVALTRTGTTLEHFLDGVSLGSLTSTEVGVDVDNTVGLYFGRFADGSLKTDFLVDEVRVYSRALLLPEISYNYSQGRIGEPQPQSQVDLEGWWHIDENTGTATDDETANNNDGTITGADWDDRSLKIYVDGVEEDSSALDGVSVADNANDWTIAQNNCIPYMEYMTIDVDGVEKLKYQPVTIIGCTSFDGTADAGSSTVKLIDAELTEPNDYWNQALLTITDTTDSLAPLGETALVTDFLAATDELQFAALSATIDAGDTYTVEFGALIDETGTNDGRITWGVHPTGVSVALGSMTVYGADYLTDAADDPSQDILPVVEVSDWFVEPDVTGSLLTNPLRPLITLLSDSTTLSEMQAWRLLALALILFTAVATSQLVGRHQGVTMMMTGAAVGGVVSLTIFPMWALVFVIGMFISGMVMERSPSL